MEKIDRVISKIVTDLALGQNDIPFGDFVEWMADALQHIGAYPQFIEKSGLVMITDYTGVLPCDVYKVIQMNKSMSVDCDSSTTGGLYSDTLINLLNDGGVDYESLDGYQRYKIIAVPGLSKVSDINTIDGLSNKLNYNGNLIGKVTDHRHTSNDFNINFNKITTGFKNGFIEIQYLSFPTDERGWPLVPDDVSFRDALFWKVAYQMSMRNPELLRNPRMKDMEYCRQQWNRCCVQARAGANMPDLAQLERFKNQWLKLIPETNLDLTSYSSLGRAQSLNLDGRK